MNRHIPISRYKSLVISGTVGVVMIFLSAGLFSVSARAQTPANIIAIDNAVVLTKTPTSVRVRAFFTNNTNIPQSDIHYGVQLLKPSSGKTEVLDTTVVPQPLSLGPNEIQQVYISYRIPISLQGQYNIRVVAENSSGYVLGTAPIGKITLDKKSSIEILGDTCVVKSGTDSGSLVQGITIKKGATAVVDCSAINHLENSVTVVPVISTFRSSIFGEKLDTSTSTAQGTDFAAGERKDLEFTIFTGGRPQHYEAVIALADNKTKALVSNKITANYTLEGTSATIEHFTIDKLYYSKDGVITANFVLSATNPAPGVSLSVKVTDTDSQLQQKLCVQQSVPDVDLSSSRQGVSMTLSRDCTLPHVEAKLLDKAGALLDVRTITSPKPLAPHAIINLTPQDVSTTSSAAEPTSDTGLYWIVIGSLLALVLMLTVYGIYIWKNPK